VINKDTYHLLLRTTRKITLEQMENLGSLTTDFPYSQNIRQLYLKALYQNQSVKFESELKKTAAFTSNRSNLKAYILNDEFESDQSKRIIFTERKLSESASVSRSKDKEISEAPKLTVVKKEDLADSNSEHSSEEKTTTNSSLLGKTVLNSELNDQFLSEAINASISIEVGTKTPDSVQKKEQLPVKRSSQQESANDIDYKKSFIQWIQHYDKEEQTKALDRATFKKKAASLIDDFINNQPKITVKKDFYSPINMANKSLKETDEAISETLADIIYQQGNSEKAIKMYQSLSLKLPEKKAYFANKIQTIRIALKDKK
jgi:hypothetical protein